MCNIKILAKKLVLSSLLVLSITPGTVSAPAFYLSSDTTSSLKELKQENELVKQNREQNKLLPLLAQSQSVTSQVEFLKGTWECTYTCDQGLTNLKLVIEARSTTEIDAVFLFSAHPQNPNVPSGSFRMKGNLEVFNSPDIPNLLDLRATTWLNRPSGYRTVDLRGDVSQSKQRITGNVLSCSTFDVVKREH